jgi:hypothetical protein
VKWLQNMFSEEFEAEVLAALKQKEQIGPFSSVDDAVKELKKK